MLSGENFLGTIATGEMWLALFFLPGSLLAISVGATMFCSPFVASYIMCIIFQTWYQDPNSSNEFQLATLFLLPIASFAMAVAVMIVTSSNKPTWRKRVYTPASHYNWTTAGEGATERNPLQSCLAASRENRPNKNVSFFTQDEFEFSPRRRMRYC